MMEKKDLDVGLLVKAKEEYLSSTIHSDIVLTEDREEGFQDGFLAGLKKGREEGLKKQKGTEILLRLHATDNKQWQKKVAELRESIKSYTTPHMKTALEDCKKMFLWDVDRIFGEEKGE